MVKGIWSQGNGKNLGEWKKLGRWENSGGFCTDLYSLRFRKESLRGRLIKRGFVDRDGCRGRGRDKATTMQSSGIAAARSVVVERKERTNG